MTDEMAIQGQRPSAMPYMLGGAALGAGVGAGAAAMGVGAKPRFSDWKAAVEDANKDDSFVKSQADKLKNDAEKVKPYNTIKDEAAKVKSAKKAFDKVKFPDGFDGKTEFETYLTKDAAVEKAQTALDEKTEAVIEKERNAIAEWTPSTEAGAKQTYEFNGKEYTKDELTGLLEKAGKDQAVEENKAAKELIDEMAKARVEGGIDKAVETEAKAVEAAKKDLATAAEALEKKKGGAEVLKKEFLDAYKPAKEGLKNAEDAAKKAIDGLLKDIKTPRYAIPTLIGAAVLGLGGLLLRPSAEEA